MPTAYIYLRLAYGETTESPNIQQQWHSAITIAQAVMPEGSPFRVYVDQPESKDGGVFSRPGAHQIKLSVERGDLVIFANLARCFRSSSDHHFVRASLEHVGVTVAVLDLLGVEGEEEWKVKDEAQRERDAEDRRAVFVKRRLAGKMGSQFPGHGFKMAGPKGARYRVPDPKQRAVMARIVELREQKVSWRCIAIRFIYDRIRTVDGREWSTDSIRRAYKAEMTLRSSPPSDKKRCCRCCEYKPRTVEFFGRRTNEADGFRRECKWCRMEQRELAEIRREKAARQLAEQERREAQLAKLLAQLENPTPPSSSRPKPGTPKSAPRVQLPPDDDEYEPTEADLERAFYELAGTAWPDVLPAPLRQLLDQVLGRTS